MDSNRGCSKIIGGRGHENDGLINPDGANPKRIVIEQIIRLERELANTYHLTGYTFKIGGGGGNSGGVGVSGASGLWIGKSRKSAVSFITSDTEEDDSSDDICAGTGRTPGGETFTGGGGGGGSNSDQHHHHHGGDALSSISTAYLGLKKLKNKVHRTLNVTTDIYYLKPFCDIIKDKDINGQITALALESLLEFLSHGFISASEHLGSAQVVAESVLRTRFTGTHTQNDEMVLEMILSVMKQVIIREFKSISNDTVCGIMHSCFEIAFEHRLSDHLRRHAKKALQEMCRSLFKRLSKFEDIPLEYGNEALRINSGSKFLSLNASRKSKVSIQSAPVTPVSSVPSDITSSASSYSLVANPSSQTTINETGSCAVVESLEAPKITSTSENTGSTEFINQQGIKFSEDAIPIKRNSSKIGKTSDSRSHDLVCIHGILSHLTKLIGHTSESHYNEDHAEVGLQLLRTAFSVSVHAIGNKQSLLAIVKDQLCFNLFQFLRHDKSLKHFALAISISSNLLIPLRFHLKYQFEAFLIKLIGLIDIDIAPSPHREMASEYLHSLFQDIPYLCHEVFYNYDCDPFSSNLYEDLLHLMYKSCSSAYSNASGNIGPQSNHGSFTAIQRTSFDTLLVILKSLQKAEFYSNEIVLKHHDNEFLQFIHTKLQQDSSKDIYSPQATMEMREKVYQDDCTSAEQVDLGTTSVVRPSSFVVEKQAEADETELHGIAIISREDTRDKIEFSSNSTCQYQNQSTIIPVITKVKANLLNLPKTISDIETMKQRKRLLWKACEQFNIKPAKGIKFLRDHGFINCEQDIISFIHDNLRLDKKQLGDFLTRKENRHILKGFVQSFVFKGVRIDEALRVFQESFRLPGEAALIEPVLEEFSSHWHDSNNRPFLNDDAAYSLAYAIIMLHTHQHNPSAKKDLGPMTCEQFIRNLRGMNGGQDYDPNLLKEIYLEINTNEIVLPFEQHGVVRENYLWKCLLRRSGTDSGTYWFALEMKRNSPDRSEEIQRNFILDDSSDSRCENVIKLTLLNEPTFLISWGPILSSITFIFDKVNVNHNVLLTRKIVNQGFASGAYLCAKYGHLDDLLISLCKFTKAFATSSGNLLLPLKSRIAAECLFYMIKENLNEIRGSWIEILRIIMDWFIAAYLDDLLEIEDSGMKERVKLRRQRNLKEVNRNQYDSSSNILTTFVSYFAGSSQENFPPDSHDCGGSQPRDIQGCSCSSQTRNLIVNTCKPLNILEDSKVIHPDSLTELVKALINLDLEMEDEVGDDVEAFRLEMLLKMVIYNRDRLSIIWPYVSGYLSKSLEMTRQSEFFAGRYNSAIYRLVERFIQRPDLNVDIFQLIQHAANCAIPESWAHRMLDLMHISHSNTNIAKKPEDSENSWTTRWCPLLQGISLFCCDHRKSVRNRALTILDSSLLNYDVRMLTAHQWENCFNKVLFPLLAKLLELVDSRDPTDLDEARTRAINSTCKVFLRHLQLLLLLPTFTALWLTILDFMDKYMKSETQPDVKEAIHESLKNLLLVMDTTSCFDNKLASITWDKIHCFLPNFKEKIMPSPPQPSLAKQYSQQSQPLPNKPQDLVLGAPMHTGPFTQANVFPGIPPQLSSPLPSPLLSPSEAIVPQREGVFN
ncbi:sec7 domain-containing protein garz [Brevipalpus obovatus]|uniref:sec7 domain-containing protein garz n=1 Tax=Brevipalpus obovatus TaxID=246614 RepID=UPI003D9FAF2E